MQEELPDHFPIQANEDRHCVGAGQPFTGRRFPFRKTITTHFAIPGNRFIMNQLSIAIPKRRPLRAGGHLIIAEDRAHIVDRVLKNSGNLEIEEVFAIQCELKRAEYGSGIGCYFTLKQSLNGWRINGVGVMVGVSVTAGVLVIVGESVMVGDNVIVGESVIEGVSEAVGEGGK